MGGEAKILKRNGGQAGPRGGCLKKGGWNAFMNYGQNSLNKRP